MSREQFEKLEGVKELLHDDIYLNHNEYETRNSSLMVNVACLNLAWYAWQEQQKKIDKAISFTDDVHSENWQNAIHCIEELLK